MDLQKKVRTGAIEFTKDMERFLLCGSQYKIYGDKTHQQTTYPVNDESRRTRGMVDFLVDS